MDRREFFRLLAGAVAAQAARPIYVLPPPMGWRVAPGETLFYLPADCLKWCQTGITMEPLIKRYIITLNFYKELAISEKRILGVWGTKQ